MTGDNPKEYQGTEGVLAGSIGALLLLIAAWRSYKLIKKRNDVKHRQKFFKKNGGFLLRQQLSSADGRVEKTKLFDAKELEKATDHYHENRILGQGGQGQKPICFTRSEENRSLATYFIQSMEENRILEILDPQIRKDSRREEMIAVAHLGKRCLHLNGKKRPTMREVAIELEGIKMSQGVSTTEQNYQEEFEYSTTDLSEVWGIASTSTTVNFLNSHKASSVDVQPLLVNKS
ncbi:similar to WALL ASSOCIATED KINASE (WAK)-LIKE 10 [Actinidia rufa]|uniref:Similar to WALL ASSOCIATED KINASE (WAK)-LIKE 10 n=1 Tax=Actinidia rufa TaxID=165716 RepID=A0A7J0EJ96_9ERIC|nr:similar to WALL ASSOCIATED KINASE (WAK)-LIKE 10 [Actinidia rufa]